ncbi:MAG: hypothetical protein Tsb002_33980 [Wenzhouxiangellaceae bacterium]
MTIALIALCIIAVAILLYAEYHDRLWLIAVSKTTAALCYLALALHHGALESLFGQWLFTALVFSFFGDVFLIPKRNQALFLIGITSFWLAHVAFAIAFYKAGFSSTGLLIGAVPALLLGGFTLRWLWPHLQAEFRLAVPAYIVVIMLMLAMAGSAVDASGVVAIGIGAAVFAISDIYVARDRFVKEAFVNRLVGLPLYFFTQFVFASAVSTIYT